MRGLGKAVTIVIAGSAALAGTAQAQSLTIAPVKPCYLAGEQITTTAAGFTPGGFVDFARRRHRARPARGRPGRHRRGLRSRSAGCAAPSRTA